MREEGGHQAEIEFVTNTINCQRAIARCLTMAHKGVGAWNMSICSIQIELNQLDICIDKFSDIPGTECARIMKALHAKGHFKTLCSNGQLVGIYSKPKLKLITYTMRNFENSFEIH